MRARLSLPMALVLLASSFLPAAGRNLGFGVVLGEPTALSVKYWTSKTTALDFALGWGGYWNGRYGRYGYTDSDCYNDSFYRRHVGYCEDRAFDYRDRHDYGGYGWHFHADYLFHNLGAIPSTERFALYAGPGINVNNWHYEFLQFGIRGNFGIAWLPRNVPLDVFLELAPVMELFPFTEVDVNAGIGSRFYF